MTSGHAVPAYRESSSQENEIRNIENRSRSVRQEGLSESINILSDEMNARFSREMVSTMDQIYSRNTKYNGEFAFEP